MVSSIRVWIHRWINAGLIVGCLVGGACYWAIFRSPVDAICGTILGYAILILGQGPD